MSLKNKSEKEIKSEIFEKSGRILGALSSPVRLKIIQLLSNGPKGVEELSVKIGQKIGNTSQHLQKMLQEDILYVVKEGTSRIYHVKHKEVFKIWSALQNLSEDLNAEIKDHVDLLSPPELSTDKSFSQVLKEVKDGKAQIIDVRPEEEYKYGTTRYAQSVPADSVKDKLKDFKKDETYYLICRGRYCTLANQAVKDMRKAGIDSYRLSFSYYELENFKNIKNH